MEHEPQNPGSRLLTVRLWQEDLGAGQAEICNLGEAVQRAYDRRAPNFVAGDACDLSNAFHAFFDEHHVLHEEDPLRQPSWLALCELTVRVLETCLSLLGMQTLDRM